MKWLLAVVISILLVARFLIVPVWIHPGWQVRAKARVCSEVARTVNRLGYRILLGQSGPGELTSSCGGERGIFYCISIPGTSPPVSLRVGFP